MQKCEIPKAQKAITHGLVGVFELLARHRTAGSRSPSHCGQRILRTWLWFPQTAGDRGSFPLQLDTGHPSKECQIGKHRGTFLKLTMDQEIRVGHDWSILLISSGAAVVQIQFLYTCFSGCMNNYMTNDTCKSTLWFQVLCSFLQPAIITDAFQIGLNNVAPPTCVLTSTYLIVATPVNSTLQHLSYQRLWRNQILRFIRCLLNWRCLLWLATTRP